MGNSVALPSKMAGVAKKFEGRTFGVVGCTGRMGSGIATLCVSQGLKTLVASRSKDKAERFAKELNSQAGEELARGCSHEELLAAKPTMTYLAMDAFAIEGFVKEHREKLEGLCLGEMTAWFAAERYMGKRPCPKPHVTTLTYFQSLCPEAKWVKCWQSVMSSSIANNKKQ